MDEDWLKNDRYSSKNAQRNVKISKGLAARSKNDRNFTSGLNGVFFKDELSLGLRGNR